MVILIGLAVLYRYGPDRRAARWQWVTVGSVFAAVTQTISAAMRAVGECLVPNDLRGFHVLNSEHFDLVWYPRCIALSALFAGLNLAIFSLSQLRLQIKG